jgi:hypothetical protein
MSKQQSKKQGKNFMPTSKLITKLIQLGMQLSPLVVQQKPTRSKKKPKVQ